MIFNVTLPKGTSVLMNLEFSFCQSCSLQGIVQGDVERLSKQPSERDVQPNLGP